MADCRLVAVDGTDAVSEYLTGAYGGRTVTVDGPFTDPDDVLFFESVKAFEDATGIDVIYIGDKEFEARLSIPVDAGNAPDIADFPQPGKAQATPARVTSLTPPPGSPRTGSSSSTTSPGWIWPRCPDRTVRP